MGTSYIALIPIFIALLILYSTLRNNTAAAAIKAIRRKRQKGTREMLELAKKFIGKECIVYTLGASQQIVGTVTEISDGAILLQKCDSVEAVNLDFVVRIREYPKKKNGKKKSVFFD